MNRLQAGQDREPTAKMVSPERCNIRKCITYHTSISRVNPTGQVRKRIVARRELPVFPVRRESLLHVDSFAVDYGVRAESIPAFRCPYKSRIREVLAAHDRAYVRAFLQSMLHRQCQYACEKHSIYTQRQEWEGHWNVRPV